VVHAGNTVLGDGVNIASRIHALAPPGGICISENVYDEIRNKPDIRAKDLGEKRLKNVSRPIRLYSLLLDSGGEHRGRPVPIRASVAIAAVVGAITIALAAYGVAKWRSASAISSAATARTIRSIAVLPLDNFSGDPNQDYFAEGMTDELTTDLAKIRALRVISRGSVMQFQGAHRPPTPEIAKLLDVDAVVEGSVLRADDKVRITAQLIDARADKHLWAKSYERDSRDVLALQDEVAAEIAREINVVLTPGEHARIADARPVNPEAYDAYLLGRFYFSRFSQDAIAKSIAEFQAAIAADPGFARAYSGLADAYAQPADWYSAPTEVMHKAKAAAEKALQLDDSLAEAHTSLATILYTYDFDWAGAEAEFHRAIALNPNYAEAHHQYGFLLLDRGQFGEAADEMKRANELDPLSPSMTANCALPLMYQGKYQAAKEQLRRAWELDPHAYLPALFGGWVDYHSGDLKAAVADLERAKALGGPPFVRANLAFMYGLSGDRAKAEAIITDLERTASREYVSPYCFALAYLGMGENQQALTYLEKAYEVRSQFLQILGLKQEHIFDPIRSDPRFIALLKKLNIEN
jgi:adenylate cyclase